ncbi:MAG: type IV toxin-antitoxin system AbiEi family antitoxin domain-containing protein [Deltaproteobacteria bacterium]|nr:type IV toxin-antitoxin system AbiEi family antitoxin domain-containing protein [Deltaproteobacteria bacterium]
MAEQSSPTSWDRLYEVAAAQDGLFTTRQAAAAGYSPQLITKYMRSGKMQRVRRGVYRLVHFPAAEHEDLVAVWLWTQQRGIFSHETALALHGLSDALPARVHVTLPLEWMHRRFRVPPGVALYYAEIKNEESAWFGSIPVTTPIRTLADCIAAHVSPELLDPAIHQAARRGLASKADIARQRSAIRRARRTA